MTASSARTLTLCALGLLFAAPVAHAGLFGGDTISVDVLRPPRSSVGRAKTVAFRASGYGDKMQSGVSELLRHPNLSGDSGWFKSEGLVAKIDSREREASPTPLQVVTGAADIVVTLKADGSASDESKSNTNKEGKTTVCVTRTALLQYTASGESGSQTLFTLSDTARKGDTSCSSDGSNPSGKLASADTLLRAAADSVAVDVALQLRPYWTREKFELESDKTVKKAVKEALDGRVGAAIAILESTAAADPYNFAANYDLGVLAEIYGDFETAVSYYNKAAAVKSDDKDLKSSQARLAKRTSQVDVLLKMGLDVRGRPPAADAAALADTVTLRGKSDTRVPLYESASTDANIVVQLPGGMKLTVFQRQGDFIEVKTLDGRQGFIAASAVN